MPQSAGLVFSGHPGLGQRSASHVTPVGGFSGFYESGEWFR